jgi:hypothetical protein
MSPEGKKFALKQLREQRQESIAAARERMKRQKKEVTALKKALGQGPATVPALAGAADLEPARVLYLLTALLRFGEATEAGMEGRYPLYRLAPSEEGQKEAPPEAGS